MRAVFDTNVVVSALVFGRRLGWLRRAWSTGLITPAVCRPTVDELLRVLSYRKFKLTQIDIDRLLGDYLPFAEIVHLPHPVPPIPTTCRDRHDVIFMQLALAATVDALVTGDTDLTVLREALLPLQVLSPSDLRQKIQPSIEPSQRQSWGG